jgi:hypothetical protein
LEFGILIVDAFVPELLPSGKFKAHSPFLVIEPSAEIYFDLFCSLPINTYNNCSFVRYRWLKNGAYKPNADGNTVNSKRAVTSF